MGIRSTVARWFGKAKDRIAAIFDRLPDIEDVAAATAAFGQAVIRTGDRVQAIEPDHIAQYAHASNLVRAAEMALQVSGAGADKLEAVRRKLQLAWPLVRAADEAFDTAWERRIRPFVVEYVDRMNAMAAW